MVSKDTYTASSDVEKLDDKLDFTTQQHHALMPFKVREVLLVSSLYDSFVFEEDGRLYELIRSQYESLNLTHAPELSRVSNGREAIALVREEKRFDLIITTLHIEDMRPAIFAKRLKEEGLIILLSKIIERFLMISIGFQVAK